MDADRTDCSCAHTPIPTAGSKTSPRPGRFDRYSVYVLKTGMGWEHLPCEMSCGSGMTYWQRLRDWQKQEVWDKIHRVLLQLLRHADHIDYYRVVVDSTSVRVVQTVPNLIDRAKKGTKHHILIATQGIPLAVRISGAHQPDVKKLISLVKSMPSIGCKRGKRCNVQTGCWPTGPMTVTAIGTTYWIRGSARCWANGCLKTTLAWAISDRLSKVRCLGCTKMGDYECAMNDATMCIRPF